MAEFRLATDIAIRQGLEELTECSICLETFKDPRMLPCIHIFCLQCLVKIGTESGKSPGDQMSCPVCRTIFVVPHKEFDSLPRNLFMERLIELTKISNSPSKQSPCDACDEFCNRDFISATMYCIDCMMNLCEKCCQHHKKSKLTCDHTLVDGARDPKSRDTLMLRTSICQIHDEQQKLFCLHCKELVCPLCYIESHKEHDWAYKEEASAGFKKQFHTQINDLSGIVLDTKKKQQSIKREKEKTETRSTELEQKILSRRDRLKDLIDEHARRLLEELTSKQQNTLKELETEHDDIERHLVSLESYRSYSSSILERGTDDEICRMQNDLLSRASDLKIANGDWMQRKLMLRYVDVDLTNFDSSFIADKRNLVGIISEAICELEPENSESVNESERNTPETEPTKTNVDKCEPQTDDEGGKDDAISSKNQVRDFEDNSGEKVTCERFDFRQTPLLVSILKTKLSQTEDRPIWGVTFLNNELFIITRLDSSIEIYDVISLSYKRCLNIKNLKDPQDIVACDANRCLYIIDWHTNEIYQIDSIGTLMNKWTVTGRGRLSITPQSNVLFTSYKKKKLIEYDPTGKQLLTVDLNSIQNPMHAVKRIDGQYILSHLTVSNKKHRLCVVNEKGHITMVYNELDKANGENIQLAYPIHVIASKDKSILVADWNRGKVIVLDSDLTYQRTLLAENSGLKLPARMHLDEQNHRLFIANNSSGVKGGRVSIFDI